MPGRRGPELEVTFSAYSRAHRRCQIHRKLLKSKIHRAIVTHSELDYEGSIGIDDCILQAAGMLPNEAVHVWDINNGERFETYVIASPRGSGEISLNGAAARLVHQGDRIIIASFCWLEEHLLASHQPTVVLVGQDNHAWRLK